jgi:iron complex transport system permease protein
MIGVVYIPLDQVLSSLFTGISDRTTWTHIVLQFRLPRAMNAVVSGAALGACGLLLQTLFRNPLADPYVLGVVYGGRLGAAVLVVVAGVAGNAYSARFGWLGDLSLAVAAAAGSTLVMLAIMFIAPRVSPVTLLIFGLMLGYLCQGLVSLVLHFTDETQAGAFNAWDDGSFSGISASQLKILIPLVAAGVAIALALIKSLNALQLGENYARSVGVNVSRARLWAFLCTAILAGVVTAYCGPIAFLGLVVAHLCRLLFQTSDHRVLMPACLIMGSVMALSTDMITHLPWSKHFLHLNAVNGILGAPVVMLVVARRRNRRALEL